ncbi:MAG TPA: hypothetical protein VMS43_13885 [Allosphingosinicella sp.]|nr:hypothetical protein [Allosphingosinicella sp.]
MPDNNHPWATLVWSLLASFAGALTALSARPFRDMTRGEIMMALIVGASFAIFVGPLVALWIFGRSQVDLRIMGGILYLMATGSNVLVPLAVRKLSSLFGSNGSNGASRNEEGRP